MIAKWLCILSILLIAHSTANGQSGDTARYGQISYDSLNNSIKVTLVPDPHKEFPNHQIGLVMRRTLIRTPGLHQIRFQVMVNPDEQPDTLFLVMVPEEKIARQSFEPEFMQSFPAYKDGEYTVDFTPISWDVHIGFMAVKKGKGQYSYTIHDYSIRSIQPPPVANFRQGNSSSPPAYRERYRYGFQGHEQDDEVKGTGNHLSFGDYGYDPRIGRRWNLEPLAPKYPELSPYATHRNNPVMYWDKDGQEPTLDVVTTIKAVIQVMRSNNIKNIQQAAGFFDPGKRYDEPMRAIYTTNRGWIDLKHFFAAAAEITKNQPYTTPEWRAEMTLMLGEMLEARQEGKNNISAWSYEDLQSNLQGIVFALSFVELEGEDFLAALESYMTDMLGATNPEEAPNYGELPKDKNHQANLELQGRKVIQNRTYNPLYKKGAGKDKVVTKESELKRRFVLKSTNGGKTKKVQEVTQ